MRKWVLRVFGLCIVIFIVIPGDSLSQTPTQAEREFMRQHEKEMSTFIEKCTGCHSAQRILSKTVSKEEWNLILKIMADKPHSNISAEELQRIQKWNDFMQSTISPRP
jgi:hypothetical protein